ncbi:hypothetical protein ACWEQ4_05525 [Rhodococcus sp. NPDC003994]
MTTVTEQSVASNVDADPIVAPEADDDATQVSENGDDVGEAGLRVGARVRAKSAVSDSGDETDTPSDAVLGTVVDDYAGTLTGDTGGRTWAVPHRWAVALDDGRLVFRDDADLEVVDSE